ncbi:MAG: virulence RhuM family protein [Pseudomonadota bacterium]
MSIQLEKTEFLLYKSDNGEIKIDVFLKDENIWLTQKKMAELFDTSSDNISLHLKNIYADRELEEKSTTEDFSVVQNEGSRSVKRLIKFYNLDTIIAVGYRVNSKRATQFRIWATKVLKEFIIKGYVMDVERLKNPHPEFGKDYFDEQLEKIRDIRSSERRFYQKITDIYSQCSIDYDKDSPITQDFFATVQNKLHFSITGQTAAEIISSRANHKKKYMGLTNWKNSPNGEVRKSDVTIAKNYLNEKELKSLNRIVSMYLDYAEEQAENKTAMTMKNWVKKLDAFLQFNEKEILQDNGKISAQIAKSLAEEEFEKFRTIQDQKFESDFDRRIKKLLVKDKK